MNISAGKRDQAAEILKGQQIFLRRISCVIDLDAIQTVVGQFQFRTCPAVWVSVNKDAAISRLQELIRFKTVSYKNGSLEDEAEFGKLLTALPYLYPNVFANCEYSELPDRALLFKWSGNSDKSPVVLMAHYDVVPADEDKWDKPPFDAIIEDGCLWGRGTLDTKVTFNGILSAAECVDAL